MGKKKRHVGKTISISMLVILLLLFASMSFNVTFCGHKPNTGYEYVMKDVVKNDTRVVDVAMLGAHDAFSNEIKLSSKANKLEDGLMNNTIVNLLGKGLCVRMAKAQNADAKELLYAGVRYFDARISYYENLYYTHHGYQSGHLSTYIEDITEFLSTHPGEFIILDIQQFYTAEGENNGLSKEAWTELYNYICSIPATDGSTIKDYVYYTTDTKIGDLTYGDLTKNGTRGGILILGKTTDLNTVYHRDSDANQVNPDNENIRSYWHEMNSEKEMLADMDLEAQYIKDNGITQCLRVNQAQETGFTSDSTKIRGILKWSLLDMAAHFNKTCISDEARFKGWLETMPIYMADNVTSNRGKFNALANQYIREYNEAL